MFCNNRAWKACPSGTTFYCPPIGDPYCKTENIDTPTPTPTNGSTPTSAGWPTITISVNGNTISKDTSGTFYANFDSPIIFSWDVNGGSYAVVAMETGGCGNFTSNPEDNVTIIFVDGPNAGSAVDCKTLYQVPSSGQQTLKYHNTHSIDIMGGFYIRAFSSVENYQNQVTTGIFYPDGSWNGHVIKGVGVKIKPAGNN